MNVNQTSELEQMVHDKVAMGHYTSASDVVREALHLMEERDRMVELHKDDISRKIAAGMDSLRADRHCDGETFFNDLDTELDEMDQRNAG